MKKWWKMWFFLKFSNLLWNELAVLVFFITNNHICNISWYDNQGGCCCLGARPLESHMGLTTRSMKSWYLRGSFKSQYYIRQSWPLLFYSYVLGVILKSFYVHIVYLNVNILPLHDFTIMYKQNIKKSQFRPEFILHTRIFWGISGLICILRDPPMCI